MLGAPGTGKSTVAVEIAVDRARVGSPLDRTLLLTSPEVAAAALRDAVTARVAGTSTQPLARTHQAFAGSAILRREAALAGDPCRGSSPVRSRTSSSGSCSPGTPRVIGLSRRGRRRWRRSGRPEGFAPSCATCSCAPSSTASRPTSWPGGRRPRPTRVGRRGLGASPSTTRSPLPCPGRAPTTRRVGAHRRGGPARGRPGGARPGVRRVRPRVVVDDAQEVTSAAARLLAAVRGRVHLVLVGDPDSAVRPSAGLTRGSWPRVGQLGDGPTLVPDLVPAGRHAGGVLPRWPAGSVPSAGRAARPVPAPLLADGQVEVAMVRAVAQENASSPPGYGPATCSTGPGWSQMANVVRGRAALSGAGAASPAAGVPVTPGDPAVALRDERGFGRCWLCSRHRRPAGGRPTYRPDVDTVVDLLTGAVGGTDPVALRRAARAAKPTSSTPVGRGRATSCSPRGPARPGAAGAGRPRPRAGLARLQRALEAGLQVMAPTRSAPEVPGGVVRPRGRGAVGRPPRWPVVPRASAPTVTSMPCSPSSTPRGFAERLCRGLAPGSSSTMSSGREVAADSLVQRAPDGEVVELLTPRRPRGGSGVTSSSPGYRRSLARPSAARVAAGFF